MARNDFGITKEEAVNELGFLVEEAHNFMISEFGQDWESAEAYYAGKCDLPTEEGRSTIVKTETRDVIRAIMPNIMRVLLHSRKPVEFMPTNIVTAPFVEQQSLWINQRFMADGGYMALYSAVVEAAKLKNGPIKVTYVENPRPEHIHATGLTDVQVVMYEDSPDIVVDEVVEMEDAYSPDGGVLYELRGTKYHDTGCLRFEAFPMYEFFVHKNASDLNSVHGHRRSITVAEALDMGLEYDNWLELDDDDPGTNDASNVATQKRGYVPEPDDDKTKDLTLHRFLLSETYCEYDMDGDGVPEKYLFYLGGTSYEYLHHEKIEDFCIVAPSLDPQPFTVIARSIADLTKQSQDNATSLLRAMVDNAHQANNPRIAGDPTRTNFNDIMTNAIGAPIRTKGTPDLTVIDIPNTSQQLLPFLQWMERDAEIRVGVTKAAQGLDPDALQSTDKQAVMNTISLSQGQIELMVRNLVETGLIPLFRMALRLSVRHMNARQMLLFKGDVVPVDLGNFDPELAAVPNVGIGTASQEAKIATLQFVYNEQKQYLAQFGMDNPFTSLSKVYNTLEDLCEMGGITNVGRYFNYIDETAEQQIAEGMAQAAAQQAEEAKKLAPLDPGKAMFMTEQLKARTRVQEIMAKDSLERSRLQREALVDAERIDIDRDRMAQDRVIELAKIGQGVLNATIKQEQDASKPATTGVAAGGDGTGQKRRAE